MADTSVDVKDTIDIVGLNDIKADLKLELPQPFTTSNSNSLEIKPLEIKPLKADLGTDTHLAIEPLKLELQADPIKTDSSLTLDLKPAVIDLCVTTNIGKLPNVCIRQPYHHHFGFTLYGVELWGLTFSGQQETVIEDLNRQPNLAWGGAVTAWPPHHPPPQAAAPPPTRETGGLRVRVEP
jgi:hypothetical protein